MSIIFTQISCSKIEIFLKGSILLNKNCMSYFPAQNYSCEIKSLTSNDKISWSILSDDCSIFSISGDGKLTATIPDSPPRKCNLEVLAQAGGLSKVEKIMLGRSLCPIGYIKVNGNNTQGTNDFCVMKYEAKCSASPSGDTCNNLSDIPISVPNNRPWRSSVTSTIAMNSCARISDSNYDGVFRLISTREWMTIAWDIESQTKNWSSGIVGSGMINRGHSDNVPSSTLEILDTTDFYDSTGNLSSQAAGSGWEQRRIHYLSNEEIIWDFAGNAWEWSDWDETDVGFTQGPTDGALGWNEPTSLSASMNSTDVSSQGGYGSLEGFGQWYGSSQGGPIRGGAYNRHSISGILAINLDANLNIGYITTGFRCVYIP